MRSKYSPLCPKGAAPPPVFFKWLLVELLCSDHGFALLILSPSLPNFDLQCTYLLLFAISTFNNLLLNHSIMYIWIFKKKKNNAKSKN